MTTLAEHIIVAGAKNRLPMLEKSMYDSWASRIRLFIKGKKRGRMMLDSIDNGPLVYPTVEENGQTRPMKYSKLTKAQKLQDDCDVQATNTRCGETLYEYYWRFSHLINDMHTIGITMYPDPLALVDNSPTLYNPSQSQQHSGSLMYSPPQQFIPFYVAPIHHQHHHTPVNPQQHSVFPQPFISSSMTQQS
ncbi:hypothetical protein Tco_1513750 [Tanacetum coccineum]